MAVYNARMHAQTHTITAMASTDFVIERSAQEHQCALRDPLSVSVPMLRHDHRDQVIPTWHGASAGVRAGRSTTRDEWRWTQGRGTLPEPADRGACRMVTTRTRGAAIVHHTTIPHERALREMRAGC